MECSPAHLPHATAPLTVTGCSFVFPARPGSGPTSPPTSPRSWATSLTRPALACPAWRSPVAGPVWPQAAPALPPTPTPTWAQRSVPLPHMCLARLRRAHAHASVDVPAPVAWPIFRPGPRRPHAALPAACPCRRLPAPCLPFSASEPLRAVALPRPVPLTMGAHQPWASKNSSLPYFPMHLDHAAAADHWQGPGREPLLTRKAHAVAMSSFHRDACALTWCKPHVGASRPVSPLLPQTQSWKHRNL